MRFSNIAQLFNLYALIFIIWFDFFSNKIRILVLEEKSAKLLEKEAALFLPSGLMGNLIASK